MGSICQKNQDDGFNTDKYIPAQTEYLITEFSRQEDIKNVYKFDKTPIGSGSFGFIRVATLKNLNFSSQSEQSGLVMKYAVKTIKKSKIDDVSRMKSELEILMTVDHPNVIQFYENYEDQKYFHIVMELCTGGQLFDVIYQKKQLLEAEAKYYMEQMISAVNYLHGINICHRDLKPNNFLFENNSDNARLKLIDFGLAKKLGVEKKGMSSIVGTPYYIAPEILKREEYGTACDIWSLGVILYVMISGKFPFGGQNDAEVMFNIINQPLTFPGEEWEFVSPEAQDLISSMIRKDPNSRISLINALKHPWFKQNQGQNIYLSPLTLQSMKSYSQKNQLYKKLLQLTVKYLSSEDLSELRAQFECIDQTHSGQIQLQDFDVALRKLGQNTDKKNIQEMLNYMDIDKDGKVNYTEFLCAALDQQVNLNQEKLWKIFKIMDDENKNVLTNEKLIKAFNKIGKTIEPEMLDEMLKDANIDPNVGINFKQFCSILDRKSFYFSQLIENFY